VAVTFVETHVFTRRILRLGLDDALPRLQVELSRNPDAGHLEPGTGGLRKGRMPDPARAKGKRGGARVHYLSAPHRQVIYLVFVYSKDESDTLAADQRRLVRAMVRRIKLEHGS
jgi:hypothetical protein